MKFLQLLSSLFIGAILFSMVLTLCDLPSEQTEFTVTYETTQISDQPIENLEFILSASPKGITSSDKTTISTIENYLHFEYKLLCSSIITTPEYTPPKA